MFRFLTFILAFFLIPAVANAACSGPVGAGGEMLYNFSQDVMQYCDNTNWIDMGPNPGDGGSGCSGPAGVLGEMLYNSTVRAMQYCDGNDWISMGPEITMPSATDLVAHWEFDETSGTTAYDSQGIANNNGTLVGNTAWAPSSGIIGGAVLFDGTNDSISFPNIALAGGAANKNTFAAGDYQTVTISGWTRITVNSGNYDHILDGIGGVRYLSWRNGGTSDRRLQNMTSQGFPKTANYFPVSNGAMTIGTWKHFAITIEDGVGFKIYLDGELDKEVSYPTINLDDWGCTNAPCEIGEDNGASDFNGYIDDIRVYKSALTEDEVMGLYALGAATGCISPAGIEGEMQYNSTDNAMQYCNGLSWITIGK